MDWIILSILWRELGFITSMLTLSIFILVLGLLSIVFSLYVKSIIGSLLIALTMFAGAFIIPHCRGADELQNNQIQDRTRNTDRRRDRVNRKINIDECGNSRQYRNREHGYFNRIPDQCLYSIFPENKVRIKSAIKDS